MAPGSDRGISLQKVINDRRRKRSQKNDAKKEVRRDDLLKKESELRKQRNQQAEGQNVANKEADEKIAELESAKKQLQVVEEEQKIV